MSIYFAQIRKAFFRPDQIFWGVDAMNGDASQGGSNALLKGCFRAFPASQSRTRGDSRLRLEFGS